MGHDFQRQIFAYQTDARRENVVYVFEILLVIWNTVGNLKYRNIQKLLTLINL